MRTGSEGKRGRVTLVMPWYLLPELSEGFFLHNHACMSADTLDSGIALHNTIRHPISGLLLWLKAKCK